ncbi:MAG: Mur ligase family protein, partial [Pseudomonadota bacterium]
MNAARKQANAGQPLSALLDGIAEVDTDVAVAGVATDSREVVEGGLFMAAVGHSSHGLNWLADALERKPAAVAWQPGPGWAEPELPAGVVGVMVPSLARRVGVVADRFFDAPSADVAITAITGTNGKTTTAHIVAQGGALVGEPTGEMGTLGFGTPQDMHSTALTTPDAVTVHRNIASLRDAGIRRLAMEVSSHGLDQGRVTGVRFDTAVFTNLSRDH